MLKSKFKADVLEAVQGGDFGPGMVGAVDFSKILGLVEKLDAILDRYTPLIESFTPDQYDVVVRVVAAVIDAAVKEFKASGF